MQIVKFSDVRNEIISNFQRSQLIPIIGSGFSSKCASFRGTVPSGEDYRQYMISKIVEYDPSTDATEIQGEKFPDISDDYHEIVPREVQEAYLRNNFTKVTLEDYKQDFLSLPWPYIYTLNIDDGIERCSEYSYVIYANRDLNADIFDYERCVIKLHGDVNDMLTYHDSSCEIFTQQQYISSLKTNEVLLSKLRHDSVYQNLLFIGCSLASEIDLLSSLVSAKSENHLTSKYYCVTEEPSHYNKRKLEKYGITHCVLFSSFRELYEELYAAGMESQQVLLDDLDKFKSFTTRRLGSDYESNRPYLFYGKSLIEKDHTITLPHFFITRKQATQILSNFTSCAIQMLIGSRCSGKSYILADIASRIRDQDVYLFETKDRLSTRAFEQLLSKKNCVVLADNASITNEQFAMLLDNIAVLERNNFKIVVVANKKNRGINDVLKLYEIQGRIDISKIPQIDVSYNFTSEELQALNPLLAATNAGIFTSKQSIIDNIIVASERLREKNKFYNTAPKMKSYKDIASLIALGIERKIYSFRASRLGLNLELEMQCRLTDPLIDSESTWSFETSPTDNSPIKYVLNAEYWLWQHLQKFAQDPKNHKIIVDAYQYTINQITIQEGVPDLYRGNPNSSYKDYIFFDNINRLFSSKNTGRNGIAIIRIIYEGLNEHLAMDPNYMHQRAKCYIKSSFYEKTDAQKISYLDKAYRDVNLAVQVFSERYDESGSEKLIISIDHTLYTQALILCHKCSLNNYQNISENSDAVRLLHKALFSPYNSYSFAKNDSFNYRNVIKEIVQTTIAQKDLVYPEVYEYLKELFALISDTH